ncbi:DUF4382 domain-containing protein [Flavobacterium sp. ASW18X]|uniref:DUF4382 domain-containing protein n=1 Tax=Flavobacterium sp. ASW18X TaxID=2572595 RepID=UPI0010AE5670|nr:DUF4382 domain-containing protein [Flavobacterium sp. ASW18X]TKD62564.1 DUF4382 domain-containing protein [Flavobacterium sp. ASW18X]
MRKSIFYAFTFAAILMYSSCESDDSNTSTEETGKLTVSLTDAPFPYDLVAEANVTVFKVDARLVGEDDEEEVDEENDGGFITLMEDEIGVNLLDLTNGTTELLADIEVPVGTYDLVRIYVKGVNVVLTDGRVFDLKVPSGEQTGIKVFIKQGLTVNGGLSSDLLLDFDVSRSFVAKGNINSVNGINGFNFKPVIKASNLSTAGTLFGNVSSLVEEQTTLLEGAQISIITADTLNTSGFTDSEGNYKIMGLEAGMYKVLAELEGYMPSDTLEVSISAANLTQQDFILEATATEETETTEGN